MPYVKYYTAGNKLAKFSKKDVERGSRTKERLAYDITFYDWTIRPDYDKKTVEGKMDIHFKGGLGHNVILVDLQRRLKIDSLLCTSEIEKYQRKGDALYIYFKKNIVMGENYLLSIKYHGKPANVENQGPIVWSEDRAGNPFYSTLTQGIGPHYLFPCKDMLYDEPDSCTIRVGIKEDLRVVANGKLTDSYKEDEWNYYVWKVNNPINVYNVSFNVGKYARLDYTYESQFTGKQTISAWALQEDLDKAQPFYSQAVQVMLEYEKLFGEFPWKEDGCAFVESAINGGAMEHQSAISMGKILSNNWRNDTLSFKMNSTLVHELAHEWWGNSVTAEDYCDAWLHEGLATYCEALIAERLNGKPAYRLAINFERQGVDNQRPVQKTCGVRYNSWAHHKDHDIYNKGALFLHTIRQQLNDDEKFFAALSRIYDENKKGHITTETFQQVFEEETGKDLAPYFEVYLTQNIPPVLQYHFNSETKDFYYRWKNQLPEGFKMKVLLGEGDFLELYPTYDYQKVTLRNSSDQVVAQEFFGYILIEKDKKFKG
jgi:aminopeptidase N